MTNLSTMSSQSWLTRGRLLVGLPLGLGVLVSVAVVVLGVRPLLQTVQGLEERRDTLLSLQRSLPALERQLSQAEVELRVAVEKQALLLGLLAGRNKVQTFLALLNQQALASGVQMQRYEPLKTPPLAQGQSRRNNNRSNGTQKAEQPQDPLQALGYRKSYVCLAVSGPFWGLQTFLQRMEALRDYHFKHFPGMRVHIVRYNTHAWKQDGEVQKPTHEERTAKIQECLEYVPQARFEISYCFYRTHCGRLVISDHPEFTLQQFTRIIA